MRDATYRFLARIPALAGGPGLLVVLLLVGPAPGAAQDRGFEMARVDPGREVESQLGVLPRPLTRSDAERYRRIFALQTEGRWNAADRLIDGLGNPMLMGHVLAQRYLHPTAYRSRYDELAVWLERYADHPQAARIHRLAEQRRPEGAPPPPEPVAGYLNGSGQELARRRALSYSSPASRTADESARVRAWLGDIEALVARDRPTQATGLLEGEAAALADEVEVDLARWLIARGYFANRMDEEARDYALPAAERSGDVVPDLFWTAGLVAWRLGDYGLAARHFAALATSDADAPSVSAGAFWAARAFLNDRRPQHYSRFLRIAADASDSFYGILAQALLGRPIEFAWHETGLDGKLLGLLVRFPGSRRAIALGQTGEKRLAAAEIRKLAARARPNLGEALAALAERLDLPAAQMRVAQRLRLLDGRSHDGAMYPVPSWEPEGGFRVDRALLLALMRAESGFDPYARSEAGALGLMQVLPSTAEAMARRRNVAYTGPASLKVPETNLALGQAYVRRLLETGLVGDNLILLAVAYNAGLSRLEDWHDRLGDLMEDPLLFIESVPVPETRAYARKVMANLWAYRARLGQPIPSLRALAANLWPTYVAVGPVERHHARTD